MDISNIKVILTEKDLEGIINEILLNYMKIPEIKIDKVVIDKFIIVNGTFLKRVSIPFELKISILELANNELTLVMNNINIKKLNVGSIVKNFALKAIAQKFHEFGIFVVKDIIKINFNKLCKVIPMVRFNLKALNLMSFGLEAQLSNFSFIKGEKKTQVNLKGEEHLTKLGLNIRNNDKNGKKNIDVDGLEELQESNEKVKYYYSNFRTSLRGKFSEKYEFLHKYITIIPDIIALLIRLYKDERVSKEIKANIIIAMAYLMYPLDILPDKIPMLGKIDDITVVFFILYRILCDIPEEVIVDNWEGEESIILICKEAVEFLSKIFGVNEIKKISTLIGRLLKRGYKFFLK